METAIAQRPVPERWLAPLAELVARGDSGAISVLSAPLFVIANIFIACLVLMTLSLLITGKMFVPLQMMERRQEEHAPQIDRGGRQ